MALLFSGFSWGPLAPVHNYKSPLSIIIIKDHQELEYNITEVLSSAGFSGDEKAPFFGFLGAVAAGVFSCMGAAWETAKGGVQWLPWGSTVLVVLAGVLGIYRLIIAVTNPGAKSYSLFDGYAHLSSGVACGLAGLSAAMAIRNVGRSVALKARWNSEMRMAEVVEKKGKMWLTTGIDRGGGKTYCWLEETAFLAETGALLLVDNYGTSLSSEDIYTKFSQENCGCDWEMFEVYKHLKSLGFVIGRHGVPWSLKGVGTDLKSDSSQGASENNRMMGNDADDMTSNAETLRNCNIDGVRPVFDVYLPNSKFRKSSPGAPNYVVCLSRGCPPSKAKIEALERRCSGIPLKFCYTENGDVRFFSFDRMELPVLP